MISGDHSLEASGKVVYSKYPPSKRWWVGMSFTEITDGDLVVIAQEVEDRRNRRLAKCPREE